MRSVASVLTSLLLIVLGAEPSAAGWPPSLIAKSNLGGGRAFAIDQYGQMLTISGVEENKGYNLLKYSPTGVRLRSAFTGQDGAFRAPEAVAVDEDGTVYVADTYGARIQVFDDDLEPVATWRPAGWLDLPHDIEIGPDGLVYVKTSVEMQVLTKTGEPLARWPASGSQFGFDSDGNIVTAEQGVFHRYAASGTFLGDLLGSRSFVYPTGFLVYEDVWLVATGGSSILAFDANGVYRDAFAPEDGARLLAKGPRGEIYVDGLTHYQAPGTQLPPPPPPPPPAPSSAVMLHISPISDPATACTSGPSNTGEIVTEAVARQDGTAQYFVYVLAAPANWPVDGLKGVQLGIDHTGSSQPNSSLRIWEWRACSDAEWPDDTWPNSGGGNTLTWISCQFDQVLAVGTFHVSAYAPASMSIAGYPVTGLVKTANCDAAETVTQQTIGFDRVGWISMGGAAQGLDQNGCNPMLESCVQAPVPARPTTWGRVKSLYGSH